jgi:hypothetical protein
MADKWCHFDNWCVRLPDGSPLELNSEAGADYVLGLLERVQALEAQQHKREQRRGRKKKGTTDGNDDGDS